MRTRVPGWGQGPHLQLQPAGWLCPRPVDEGPPEPLLTVRSVAGRSPVDEVAQVLQTEDRLTGLRSSPPPPAHRPRPSQRPAQVSYVQPFHPHSGPARGPATLIPPLLLGSALLPLGAGWQQGHHILTLSGLSCASRLTPHTIPPLSSPSVIAPRPLPTGRVLSSSGHWPAGLVLLPTLPPCPQHPGPGTELQSRKWPEISHSACSKTVSGGARRCCQIQ